MKAWLRSINDRVKPSFMPGGAQAKWFPIYDAIENFIFSSTNKTTNQYMSEIRLIFRESW